MNAFDALFDGRIAGSEQMEDVEEKGTHQWSVLDVSLALAKCTPHCQTHSPMPLRSYSIPTCRYLCTA
jgi:hypothetical protein